MPSNTAIYSIIKLAPAKQDGRESNPEIGARIEIRLHVDFITAAGPGHNLGTQTKHPVQGDRAERLGNMIFREDGELVSGRDCAVRPRAYPHACRERSGGIEDGAAPEVLVHIPLRAGLNLMDAS